MASLWDMATFVLLVAIACLHSLNTVLDFWQRGLVVVPVMLLTLFITYLMGVILVYIPVSRVTFVLVSPAATRLFAILACAMACALLLLFAMPLMPFQFLTARW